MELRAISDKFEQELKANGITKAAFEVSEVVTQELSAENAEFSLYRTLFDNNYFLKIIKDNKLGAIKGNDISDEGIKKAVADAIAACESAVADEAYDIAPKQEKEVVSKGVLEPDMDKFFDRIKELIEDTKSSYSKVQIMMARGTHKKVHDIYRNTNGTDIETFDGYYTAMLSFAGNDGEKTTGIDGAGFVTNDLDKPFITQGSIKEHLDSAVASLNTISVSDKFDGTVIFTPDCLAMMMYFLGSATIEDTNILDGTSLWKDKIGQKVADERITIKYDPNDKRIVTDEVVSSDGFRTQPITIIENGILKNHKLSLYVANKTGKECAKNTSDSMIFEPGNDSYADIIKNTKRGLIVGAFSGGNPSTSGDFSGVAKNAFYVENGEIKGAVMETMINGNLMEMINHVEGISKETVLDGGMVMPYLAVSGITISGK